MKFRGSVPSPGQRTSWGVPPFPQPCALLHFGGKLVAVCEVFKIFSFRFILLFLSQVTLGWLLSLSKLHFLCYNMRNDSPLWGLSEPMGGNSLAHRLAPQMLSKEQNSAKAEQVPWAWHSYFLCPQWFGERTFALLSQEELVLELLLGHQNLRLSWDTGSESTVQEKSLWLP